MNGRVTLAMLVVAIAAAAYVYGFALPRDAADEAAEQQGKTIVAVAADQIVSLELPLSAPAGTRAKLVRDVGSKEWRLEAPRTLRADSFVVEGIVTSLGQLEVQLTIDDPAADRAQFGLGDGASRIDIGLVKGDPIHLALGSNAPVGSVRYMEASTKPGVVLAVTSSMLTQLDADLEKLRDKSVIPF